ncbi:MAG TPA: Gfo/Idh/MocA family oxidoreductase [Burkholderiales bacterium]|nr:Gfo/Idh/MocA family oxidoreductase [Burkholderiales bacterium]
MKTIRWGIIGCGHVCEVKSGPALLRSRNAAIAAVMRRDLGAARDFAKRFGVPHVYDDAEVLLNDPTVDAVYIATPPAWHRHYTRMAAAAKKPVLVEKPMAMSVVEAEEMIALCDAAGIPLFVNHFRRALPRFIEIKSRIDAGAIGEVRSFTVSFSASRALNDEPGADGWRLRAESGGNPFFDTACHHLDVLDYLLGTIADVRAHVSRQAAHAHAPDVYTASFRFDNGIQGVGSWCYNAGVTNDFVEILGTTGLLAFTVFDFEAPILLETEETAEEIVVVPELYVHRPFFECVADTLNGKGQCNSTAATALRTVRIMDRILAQAA